MAQLGKYSLAVAIASGESLSAAIDLDEGRLALIQMPASWTTANLTFQGSVDGSNFFDLYDDEGNEVTVTAAASRTIRLPLADWLALRHVKIRSGTTGTPVNQGGARELVAGLVA